MKTFAKVLLGLLVLAAALLVGLELFLGKAVLKGFNALAPSALGVPASLADANVSLLRGKLVLRGLHVGNPQGYKTDGILDLDSVVVRLDNSSLSSDTVVVREIAVDGLVVTYEKGLLNSNLGALVDLLSGNADDSQEQKPENDKPAPETGQPGKKVVVEKFSVVNSRMNFSVTGAAALTGGGSIPIPLPPVRLSDLGKDKDGVSIAEAIRVILSAVAGAAGTALAGSAHLVGNAAAAVGEGTLAVGEGALDAGKAVVGGTVDALHNLNPFAK